MKKLLMTLIAVFAITFGSVATASAKTCIIQNSTGEAILLTVQREDGSGADLDYMLHRVGPDDVVEIEVPEDRVLRIFFNLIVNDEEKEDVHKRFKFDDIWYDFEVEDGWIYKLYRRESDRTPMCNRHYAKRSFLIEKR